jgi:hypothetical protein
MTAALNMLSQDIEVVDMLDMAEATTKARSGLTWKRDKTPCGVLFRLTAGMNTKEHRWWTTVRGRLAKKAILSEEFEHAS